MRTHSILVIYTGGTIGSVPGDASDPNSPRVAASWDVIKEYIPSLDELPCKIQFLAMPPIDSSDMHPAYWIDMAREIGSRYDKFDAFVILHGTDTMCWTASALSFLLENLAKPIIVTGARRSLTDPNTDGGRNLIDSLKAASDSRISEVCICFDGVLLRGNRANKTDANNAPLFTTPHYPTLGSVVGEGRSFQIDERALYETSSSDLIIHDQIESNVLSINLTPGINLDYLREIFNIAGLKGIVLNTFGSGNAPSTKEFVSTIDSAVRERGLVIVNVSQCLYGKVIEGKYEGGALLSQAGAIGSGDMTHDAAAAKLMFLLGQGISGEELKSSYTQNLRGELTV